MKKLERTLAVSLLALASTSALAQAADPLRNAAQKAITGNPEVGARVNALRGATNAVDVARGAYLPRVDVEASIGQTRDRITTRNPENGTLSRNGVALSLRQTIWDGLATMNDVKRAGHEKLVRHFELQDVTELTALEAVRATYDVARYRQLVQLAEDNYVQHKYAHSQIQSRVRAGVGRGVDLEQATARLALAESNLATELANLHDVTARYQRVVGEAPPANLRLPAPLSQGMPGSAADAVNGSIVRSPAVSASIESLRAVRAVAAAREAAFQPKVEARVRSGSGRNFDGVPDQKRDTSAEIVLEWNLFNGGADRARVRQQADLVNQAADLRDKACRDARQTAAIAFNDTRKLAEQLVYLDRNVLAIEKARDAYRQQFDIGQRSLLDLLNAENELYTARRSYANAEHDLGIAYARTHAAMQQLIERLGIARADTGVPLPELSQWSSAEDAPARCPADANVVSATARSELDARAARLLQSAPQPPAPAPAPAPAAPAPPRR